MNAGVLRAKVKTDRIADAVKTYRELVLSGYAKIAGARGGQMWIDRETGDTLTIGFYDDVEAARAFQPVADQALAAMEPVLAGTPGGRQLFELAASTQTEAIEVVKAGFAAFNKHDGEALARLTAPDAEGWAAGAGSYRGPQGAKEFNEAWFRGFPDCEARIDNIYGQGRFVVVEGTFSGTHTGPLATSMGELPATGKKSSGPFMEVLEIDRGLVKASRLYYDRMQMAEQLGILPSPATTQTS